MKGCLSCGFLSVSKVLALGNSEKNNMKFWVCFFFFRVVPCGIIFSALFHPILNHSTAGAFICLEAFLLTTLTAGDLFLTAFANITCS